LVVIIHAVFAIRSIHDSNDATRERRAAATG
jgi:hypothetical protein